MGNAEAAIIAHSDSEWKHTFLLQVSFRDGAATTVAFAAGPAFPLPAIWTSLEIP
jgi:hypothetical protein